MHSKTRSFIAIAIVGAGLVLTSGCGRRDEASVDPGLEPSAAAAVASAAGAATQEVLHIKGSLSYLARIALPPNAIAVVELRDAVPADGPVIDESRQDLTGRQVPIEFELHVDRSKLMAGRLYSLRGHIVADGSLVWIGDHVEIDAALAAIDVGTLILRQARAQSTATTLRCGDQSVSYTLDRELMRLAAGAESFDLRQVPTASGAKYVAADDQGTWFWSKGQAGTLSLRGKALPECVPAAQSTQAFRAAGNEPSWRLDIDAAQMSFVTGFGDTRVVVPAPAMQAIAGGRRYSGDSDGRKLTATVLDRGCADAMSGMPHPNTVEVELDGKPYRGCGGEPAQLLQGVEWVVEDLGGGIIDRSRVTLKFGADGRLNGRAGCNNYMAGYTLTGEGLSIKTGGVSMMACAPALMEQEERFLALLNQVQRFEIDEHGALLLHTSDGGKLTARSE